EWEIVLAALKHQARMQGAGDLSRDVVQTAAMRILRAHQPFEGAEDGRAFKYLGTVVRRAYIDMVDRSRRRDPLDFIVLPGGDDEREPIDRVPAPDSDPARSADAPAAWAEVIDRLRGYLDEVIEEAALAPTRCESAWLQASATILAVLGKQGAREIAVALGAAEASDACIYKWSERGRPWVGRALERWAQEDDDETDRALIAELGTQLLKRRKDAGRARPHRRKERAR
ncbi:MAG: hypothetical protein FD160_3984, partial [Caulobacteraceae bacterium]